MLLSYLKSICLNNEEYYACNVKVKAISCTATDSIITKYLSCVPESLACRSSIAQVQYIFISDKFLLKLGELEVYE